MFERLAVAGLWFVAFACLHELAWSTLGSPRFLGIAFGVAAAAFVFVDPARLFARASLLESDAGR